MGILRKFITKYKESNLVFRAGIWFLCVTVIDKGIAVITQPFINRILSVAEVGVYGVYSSYSSIFSVLATLNLFGGVLEVYLTKEPEKKRGVIRSLGTLSLLTSLLLFGLCMLLIRPLSSLLSLKPSYLAIMGITVIAEMILQFWIVPKRFSYSYRDFAAVVVSLFAVKSVLSVFLAYTFTSDRVLGRILGLAIPTVVYACVLAVGIFKRTHEARVTDYWRAGLSMNLPLVPHYLASILLAMSDRFMLREMVGDTEAGLYAVAYSYASLALIVFTALNGAYNPFSMRCIADKRDRELSRSTEFLVTVSVLFCFLMMLLAPEGIAILGGKAYRETVRAVPVLITGIFFSSFYFIFSNVEFVYERTKLVFPITVLGAGVNILLNYLYIPRYGYFAAAVTTLIGYFLVALCHYIASRWIAGRAIYDLRHILPALFALMAGTVGTLFLYEAHPLFRYVATLAVSAVLMLYFIKQKDRLRGV